MENIFIVQASDCYGMVYNLGAFRTEEEAYEVTSILENYASYEDALERGESLDDIPEPPQLPPQLVETHKGQINWSDAWVLQLPICKNLSECDLY